jgi:membrane protein YdbS with pleckstrin-like domain
MPIDTRDWYREEYRRKHPEEYLPPKVSWAWWLLVIFLTWIGGVIAWGCTRKKVGKRARTYIWVGIAIFVVAGIIGLAWFGI